MSDSGLTLLDLRDQLIAEGKQSVLDNETRPSHVLGGLAGFELCRTLETREDYERVLRERHQAELEMHGSDMDIEAYWQHRYATLQVEHVYKVLCVAWGDRSVSGRALLQYAKIVGIKES